LFKAEGWSGQLQTFEKRKLSSYAEDINAMLPWNYWYSESDSDAPTCFLDSYFRMRQSGLKQQSWCRVHEKFCPLCDGSDFEVGGFPCQPHSRMGAGLKEEDARFLCVTTWAFHLKRRNILAAILENVFETRKIQEVFSSFQFLGGERYFVAPDHANKQLATLPWPFEGFSEAL
jgi:hypothetical protein